MLVIATNARMNVIYALVRVKVLFTLNVVLELPPPSIAARRTPCIGDCQHVTELRVYAYIHSTTPRTTERLS